MKEQTEVRTLKLGRYVVIDDEPCSILGLSHAKPGKHGSAKARVDAIGVFDGQKRSIVQPVTAKIYVPMIDRRSGQILMMSEDSVQLMDMDTYETFDIKLPDELKGKLRENMEVSYLDYDGRRKLDVRT